MYSYNSASSEITLSTYPTYDPRFSCCRLKEAKENFQHNPASNIAVFLGWSCSATIIPLIIVGITFAATDNAATRISVVTMSTLLTFTCGFFAAVHNAGDKYKKRLKADALDELKIIQQSVSRLEKKIGEKLLALEQEKGKSQNIIDVLSPLVAIFTDQKSITKAEKYAVDNLKFHRDKIFKVEKEKSITNSMQITIILYTIQLDKLGLAILSNRHELPTVTQPPEYSDIAEKFSDSEASYTSYSGSSSSDDSESNSSNLNSYYSYP